MFIHNHTGIQATRVLSIVFLGPSKPSRSSSVYYPDEFNCSDTSMIEALPKDLLSALELSQKSDQLKVTVKSDKKSKYEDHQINKYTNNNYYITNGRKESQQIDPPDLDQIRSKTCSIRIPCINDGKPRVFELPRALKFIGKHTLNIVYGMLGSILASALTGAIYSIISGSDTENTSETFFTTRSIMGIATKITTEPTITNSLHSSILQPTTTGIATKITTQPTISNLLYSSITQPTTNSGTQGLFHGKCFVC